MVGWLGGGTRVSTILERCREFLNVVCTNFEHILFTLEPYVSIFQLNPSCFLLPGTLILLTLSCFVLEVWILPKGELLIHGSSGFL